MATVLMPNVSGTCTAFFRVDYQGAVSEPDEANNVASFTFTLQPRPAPNLSIIKFQDDHGCCTTNRGNYIYPNIWIYNSGLSAPVSNVPIKYEIKSPIATGGVFILIGYGTMDAPNLKPGGTGHDSMDSGRWQIPKTAAWKKQWHTVRGCIHPQGGAPTGGPGDVCAYYARYSKD